MADESLDVQLRVLTQQASRDAKKFLADMQRELNKGMRPQAGKQSEDPFTAGMRAGTQKMREEQRERENILKQNAAAMDRERKAAERNAEVARKASEKATEAKQKNLARVNHSIHSFLAKQRKAQEAASEAEQRANEKAEEAKRSSLNRTWMSVQKFLAKQRVARQRQEERDRVTADREAEAKRKADEKKVESDRKARNQMWTAMQKGMARRRKLRDAEVAAEQKAAQAVAAAWATEAAQRRTAIAQATKGQSPTGNDKLDARIGRESAVLLGMATDRSVPLEKVKEQQDRLTAIVAAAGKERLSVIRRSEEQAVQAREVTSDRTIDITRIRNDKLRAAAARVQAEMLAAAKTGDADQIARATRLGDSLVAIKKRDSQELINQIIQQEVAAGRISAKQAAEMMAMQGAIGKNASRSALQLFQLQQAMEDASAALSTGQGLPGVIRATSNNLALMANLMGGTGGTIALYGLMAVSVASVSASLWKLLTTTKQQNEEAKKQNELLREELKLRLMLAGENAKAVDAVSRGMVAPTKQETDRLDKARQAIQDIIRGGGAGGLVGDVAGAITKDAAAALENLGRPISDLLKAADDSGRLQSVQEELRRRDEVNTAEGVRLAKAERFLSTRIGLEKQINNLVLARANDNGVLSAEDIKRIDEMRSKMDRMRSEFSKEDGGAYRGMFPGGKFNADMARKQIEDSRKALDDAVGESRKMELAMVETLRNLQKNAELKAQGLIAEAESNDVAANVLALILEQNDAVQKQLAFRKRLADMGTAEEAANRRMMDDAERRKADAEAELATANRIFEKEKDRIAAIQDEAKKAAELLKAQEDHNEAVDKHKAVLEEINILEEERKRIQQEQLSNQRDMLRDKERELEQGRRQIEQAIELQKRLMEARQSSRDSFEGSAFDIVRGRTQEMTGRQAEVAKSNLSPFLPQQVREFYGQIIDQQFSQLAKLRDDALLEIRGKFLTDQAIQAGSSGDVERQRKLLEELQGLQLGVAANDPDMARGRAAFEAAKETQKLIEETYKNQFDAEQARIERLEQSNAKLVTALDKLRAAVEKMERAARGLPPEGQAAPPVEAPKPPAPGIPGGRGKPGAPDGFLMQGGEFMQDGRMLDGPAAGVKRAGDQFEKAMREIIDGLHREELLGDPLGKNKAPGADKPDPNVQAINQNTKQTEREVAQHSSKTDTTNAILRELVAVQRQIASTPPTVIVAGGGGGGGGFPGFPMPTFPGFPGGGGGPIREEPAGGFGGFGGAFAAASTTNNNTFGQVMINVANMNQAQDLFRGMSLASRANSLRAGR